MRARPQYKDYTKKCALAMRAKRGGSVLQNCGEMWPRKIQCVRLDTVKAPGTRAFLHASNRSLGPFESSSLHTINQ